MLHILLVGIECDRCGNQLNIDIIPYRNINNQIEMDLREEEWEINGEEHFCSDCVEENNLRMQKVADEQEEFEFHTAEGHSQLPMAKARGLVTGS